MEVILLLLIVVAVILVLVGKREGFDAVPPAPQVTSTTAPLPTAMPTPTGGNTFTSLPIPGMQSVAPQAAGVMTSTPVGAPLGSGAPHGILLTMV
jgi:hypothetical protein